MDQTVLVPFEMKDRAELMEHLIHLIKQTCVQQVYLIALKLQVCDQ